MNTKLLIYAAYTELTKTARGTLKGTKIEDITNTIEKFAIFSAVAATTAAIPNVGGVISMISQTGLVWGTYIAINKQLGISMSDNLAKFIGSAMLTNLATNAASYLVAYIGAGILSLLPISNILSIALLAVMGYVLIYASAILYLKLLTEVMRTKGTFNLDESDATKNMIKNVVKNSNVKEIIKEGRNAFKEAQKNGQFQAAKDNPTCPHCGETIKPGQKFCSRTGAQLF